MGSWAPFRLQYDADAKLLDATVRLEYCDSNGTVSSRDVHIERFVLYGKDEGAIEGYCKLRQARRTFVLDRVLSAECMATRRYIGDLAGWLRAKYARTPAGRRDAFIDEYWPALGVLHAVAKADGSFRQAERALIADFVKANSTLHDAEVSAVVAVVASWRTPSAISVGKDLRALESAAADLKAELLAFADAIVATDKSVHSAEEHLLRRLQKALKPKATRKNV